MKPETIARVRTAVAAALLFVAAVAAVAAGPEGVTAKMNACVFLKDGTRARGYLMSYPLATDKEVRLNYLNRILQSDRRYAMADIDSMHTWMDDEPQLVFRWLPVRVRMTYAGASAPSPVVGPSLAVVAYEGRNVRGFVVSDAVFGDRCAYITPSMEYAVCIVPLTGRLSGKRRKSLELEFGGNAKMLETLRRMPDDWLLRNPFRIVEALDSTLDTAAGR